MAVTPRAFLPSMPPCATVTCLVHQHCEGLRASGVCVCVCVDFTRPSARTIHRCVQDITDGVLVGSMTGVHKRKHATAFLTGDDAPRHRIQADAN